MIKVSKKRAFITGIIISLVCAIILSAFLVPEFQKIEAFSNLSFWKIVPYPIPTLFIIFEIPNLAFIAFISGKK